MHLDLEYSYTEKINYVMFWRRFNSLHYLSISILCVCTAQAFLFVLVLELRRTYYGMFCVKKSEVGLLHDQMRQNIFLPFVFFDICGLSQ